MKTAKLETFAIEPIGDGTFQTVFPKKLAKYSQLHSNPIDAASYLLETLKNLDDKQYCIVEIVEHNGEQEYTFRVGVILEPGESIEERAEQEAKTWYDDEDVEKVDGEYQFFAGSLIAKVLGWQLVSREEYYTMNHYGVI